MISYTPKYQKRNLLFDLFLYCAIIKGDNILFNNQTDLFLMATRKKDPRFEFLQCELKGNSLIINIKGEVPTDTSVLTTISEVQQMLATLALRTWEQLMFVNTEIKKAVKGLIKVVITLRRETLPLEKIIFHHIKHTDKSEVGLRLQKTNRVDAALTAAEYAVENNFPVVVACYMQGNSQSWVKVLNFRIYKRGINSGDMKTFERFIGKTGCLLYRDHGMIAG